MTPALRVNLSAWEAEKASFLASTREAGPTEEGCSHDNGRPEPERGPDPLTWCSELVVNTIYGGPLPACDEGAAIY